MPLQRLSCGKAVDGSYETWNFITTGRQSAEITTIRLLTLAQQFGERARPKTKETRMRVALMLAVSALTLAAQDVVFRGTPTIRVFATPENDERQKLDAATAQKNECVIVQRGKNKYFWASRNNEPLRRVDLGQFTYFIHDRGAGYVKVFTGSREEAKAPADYVENINRGFEVVTYWGRANAVQAQPVQAEPVK